MKSWRVIFRRFDRWTTWGGSGVADEAEAFLEGRLLERQRADGAGGRVPPWMWLNTVAHGGLAEIVALADQRASGLSGGAAWRNARSQVARELTSLCGGDERVLHLLQAEVLVPLELRLSNWPDLTPARMLELTLAELRLAEA
jgi:hypothetical protein